MVSKLIKKVLIITAIFTVIDFILHIIGIEGLFPQKAMLPPLYFIFKILILPVILFILISRFKLKGFALCILAAIALQIRYSLVTDYGFAIHFTMIVIHYFMILGAIFITDRFIIKSNSKTYK